MDGGGLVLLLPGFHQRYESEVEQKDRTREGMNLVVIEEHQAGDFVFAQLYYLYILLEATLACVVTLSLSICLT